MMIGSKKEAGDFEVLAFWALAAAFPLLFLATHGFVFPAMATIVPDESAPRRSITFLMGEDTDSRNSFYANAIRYYREDPFEKTSFVETGCRSFTEVREYLASNCRASEVPWGRVNLVVHGNGFTGFSAPVRAGEGRADRTSFQVALMAGDFRPATGAVIDGRTEFHVISCGTGRLAGLGRALAEFFRSERGSPRIFLDDRFQLFQVRRDGKRIERIAADARYWFAPIENVPIAPALAEQMRKYPERARELPEARLMRRAPGGGPEPFYRSFAVAFEWRFLFSDDDPILNEKESSSRRDWMAIQPEIRRTFAEAGLDEKDFLWQFENERSLEENAGMVRVSARAAVLCRLTPLS